MTSNDFTATHAKPAHTAANAPTQSAIASRNDRGRPGGGPPPATSGERFLEEALEDLVRVEVLLGERARRGRVTLVVGGDQAGPRFRFGDIPERQQSFADGVVASEAGVLDEGRLSGCEVADGAVAEPAAVRLHVDALRDRELGPRALDEVAKLE